MIIGYLVNKTGEVVGNVYLSTFESGGWFGALLLIVGVLFIPLFALAVVLSAFEQFGVYLDLFSKNLLLYVFIVAYLLINLFISYSISKFEKPFFTFFCYVIVEALFATVVFTIAFSGHIYELAGSHIQTSWWFKVTYCCDSFILALIMSVLTMIVGLLIGFIINSLGSPEDYIIVGNIITDVLVVALIVFSVVYLKNTSDDRIQQRKTAVQSYVDEVEFRVENLDDRNYDGKIEQLQQALSVVQTYDEENTELINNLSKRIIDYKNEEEKYISSGEKRVDEVKRTVTLFLFDKANTSDYTKDSGNFRMNFDTREKKLFISAYEGEGGSITYPLYGSFNKVTGNIKIGEMHQDYVYKNTYIEFYGDGKQIYKTPNISAYCNIDLDVDVKNVENLKIVIHTDPSIGFYSGKMVMINIYDFIAQ